MELRFQKSHPIYKCFSNFYPISITYDGINYKSTEAAWQAQKCINKNDRKQFSELTPSAAKSLGRKIKLRKDWENIKYDLMIDICTIKFQDKKLREILKNTKDATIIEDTTGWHDNIWGDCSCEKCKNIPGQNLLGKALMEIRNKI